MTQTGSLRSGWMGYLQDENKDPLLTELTIPGTHDTGTWKLSGGDIRNMSSKCQDMDLGNQLGHGIRFIDIRLVPETNNGIADMAIYHSGTNCDLWFSDVLQTCRAFLTANDKETIIMSIKNEHEEVLDKDFVAAMDAILQANSDIFYTAPTVPRLSESKGRIVLFRRYLQAIDLAPLNQPAPAVPVPAGIDATIGWPHDNKTKDPTEGPVPMMIQDVFGMQYSYQGDIKWNDHVLPFLEEAINSNDKTSTWWINFTSTSGGGYPITFADEVNPLMQTWLESVLFTQGTTFQSYRLGTVIMDFPTPRLIDALIAMNIPGKLPIIRQSGSYTFRLADKKAYIGQAYRPGSWNYVQCYTDSDFKQNAVRHALVKVGGADTDAIHFGDTVRILSTQFTSDAYVYIESYGSGSDDKAGKNLFYDNAAGYWKGNPQSVEWTIERSVLKPSPLEREYVKPGDSIRFRSVLRDLCYLAAQTDQYLAVKPLDYLTDKNIAGGFDWVLE